MKRLLLLILVALLFSFSSVAYAVDCEGDPPSGADKANEIREYIDKCQAKITSLQSEQNTLKAALTIINSRINLAQGQINQTVAQIASLEKDIEVLLGVVSSLTDSRSQLEETYQAKVREVYKNRNLRPLELLISSNGFADYFTKIKYLKLVRTRDQLIIQELDKARQNYDQQKQLKQNKQEEVEKLKDRLISQKVDLDAQQKQKQVLLVQTQNDEKRYQTLLTKAREELLAIEAVIAGKGKEQEAGSVSAGDRIATIISGVSPCSTGTHLHFEVAKDKVNQNPANYLKSISIVWDNSPDPVFGFGGSWTWPLNDPVRITQGYGHTAYSSRYANHTHTGIDMVNGDLQVKAVSNGTLYRGSISCGGGTLKYVHVKHKDDGLDTYYLHVNYF